VVYGGSDMYTAHDNDWREAAGILRTLSRSLYCLEWLDLTGCGSWFDALRWTPPATSSSDDVSENVGPEWNGGWRGLRTLILRVGWQPAPSEHNPEADLRYHIQRQTRAEIKLSAEHVASHLRSIRKSVGGSWLDVQHEDEPMQSI
jgi:hypothetical protein